MVSGIRDPRSRIRDPGSGIRDGKKPGSGINIPDPQHCFLAFFALFFHALFSRSYFALFFCALILHSYFELFFLCAFAFLCFVFGTLFSLLFSFFRALISLFFLRSYFALFFRALFYLRFHAHFCFAFASANRNKSAHLWLLLSLITTDSSGIYKKMPPPVVMTSLAYIQDQVLQERYFLQGPCFYGQRRICLALCILSSLYGRMSRRILSHIQNSFRVWSRGSSVY